MHLTFLPDSVEPSFFAWNARREVVEGLWAARARRERVMVLSHRMGVEPVNGWMIPLRDALGPLSALSTGTLDKLPASFTAWSLAAKLALELVSKERIVPRLIRHHTSNGDRYEARFAAALGAAEDAQRFMQVARLFPLAAHALPYQDPRQIKHHQRNNRHFTPPIWAPEVLLRAFLDFTCDMLVRDAVKLPTDRLKLDPRSIPWERRLLAALVSSNAVLPFDPIKERTLPNTLQQWIDPLLNRDLLALRPCFRLSLPRPGNASSAGTGAPDANGEAAEVDVGAFSIRFYLQPIDEPNRLIPAHEVWSPRRRHIERYGRSFERAADQLLKALAVSARIYPPIARCLSASRPTSAIVTPEEASEFLTHAAVALIEQGFSVVLPPELSKKGHQRLRLRLKQQLPRAKKADDDDEAMGGASGMSTGLSLQSILSFKWEAALGDHALSPKQLQALTELQTPLIRYQDQWVLVDPQDLAEVQRILKSGTVKLTAGDALTTVLGGRAQPVATELPVEVLFGGQWEAAMAQLRQAETASSSNKNAAKEQIKEQIKVPKSFVGELRPYQQRGFAWLAQMADLGLGACLADDMGLGKTIQLIVYLLSMRAQAKANKDPDEKAPALLVCPTSVIGNWEREVQRFAPSMKVVAHYGPDRADTLRGLQIRTKSALVLTTYGVLRRDIGLLSRIPWAVAALDEAQNIKNPSSDTAQAARQLQAARRFALTGTPIENRLSELWSIFEFLNPRLLGPFETFRREYALPIERYHQADVAEQLRKMVRPFLLRRVKSDPNIISDLPPKQEFKVICTLTREQASLYQAAVDDAMKRIEAAEGIQRRGLVLALITALKQICNHPAHYLGEEKALSRRSGKLSRLSEMLEEVVAAKDRALIFTQFTEMGQRLEVELKRRLKVPTLYLHGGLSQVQRDRMVEQFQRSDSAAPPIFILSLRAGGTGLNLTAANHVFHFDRWWNPAVEDQATDRAYRIGQTQHVQVHKFICAGTMEEKVDLTLEKKRNLAGSIVEQGEQWITELSNAELRDLCALAPGAVVDDANQDGDDT